MTGNHLHVSYLQSYTHSPTEPLPFTRCHPEDTTSTAQNMTRAFAFVNVEPGTGRPRDSYEEWVVSVHAARVSARAAENVQQRRAPRKLSGKIRRQQDESIFKHREEARPSAVSKKQTPDGQEHVKLTRLRERSCTTDKDGTSDASNVILYASLSDPCGWLRSQLVPPVSQQSCLGNGKHPHP